MMKRPVSVVKIRIRTNKIKIQEESGMKVEINDVAEQEMNWFS